MLEREYFTQSLMESKLRIRELKEQNEELSAEVKSLKESIDEMTLKMNDETMIVNFESTYISLLNQFQNATQKYVLYDQKRKPQ